MKKHILILFALLNLTGCQWIEDLFTPDDKYFYLPADGKSNLMVGDILNFKSNLGDSATYRVMKVWYGNFYESHSSKDGGNHPPFYYYESQIVYIDTIDRVLTQSQKWLINMLNGGDILMPGYVQYAFRSDFISICSRASSMTQAGMNIETSINWYYKGPYNGFLYGAPIKVLNRSFDNAFSLAIDSGRMDRSKKYIKMFYCNRRYGLVGFKYSDGEIFELVE